MDRSALEHALRAAAAISNECDFEYLRVLRQERMVDPRVLQGEARGIEPAPGSARASSGAASASHVGFAIGVGHAVGRRETWEMADVHALAEWLSGTAPSVAIQSTFWFIRLLQATHLLTAGVVTAAGVLVALRVIGWHRADQPFDLVWRRFAPWLAWGLAVMLATGIGQTLGDPVRELTATSYWVKMALLLGAVAGTWGLAGAARHRPSAPGFSPAAKVVAAGLVLCWLTIPLLGRMIAYDRAIWGGWSLRT